MSTQAEQQQQQQQPVVVYPSSVTFQTAPASHSDPSGGSFVAVFIVVAIIIVTSAISCFLGRFCSRQMSRKKPAKVEQRQSDLCPGEANIEFGSDGRINPGDRGETDKGLDFKMPGNGDHREFRVREHVEPAEFGVPGNGYPELRMPENGDYVRFRIPGNADPVGFRMPGHGDFNGETKPVDDGSEALKAGA
ncbi:hypothetical protein F3Y22_tig00013808pilonHSYRG00065 [Hibiscus syriacus]|uniref:Uncharacterized protein n=1 Tax=Hibiscus syriacus TaxID=106335 RepID=A0A6A3C3L5_HIBSY|nr:uncharacterized protein LOC120206466 [Hibiscus syriacus]KAE8722641.1 hypothetical protein F3Y22_tig00013808pilonHSYRG00065 [Hibiscus syriacus]